ncbi:BglG family transcription antiterminator [Niallia sp. Krafla_26]|uniref:BglG family transcription antiterminator n=1 Tax=Niallia sp. Krafla_26 TaxID=3064703 RepID=UPI003D163EB6
MIMTAREKVIVELIVKNSGRHSVSSLAEYLRVSTRTVQRDLKSIEKTLEQFDLLIENTSGLMIRGANQNIYRLIQELIHISPVDLSAEERRLLAFVTLFDASQPIKLAPLAKDLGVSVTTLGTDLDELTLWLQKYGVVLERKKGVGVELTGLEESKRKALVNYYLIYFNDELIENLFLLANNQAGDDKILYYLNKDYLRAIDKLVYPYINQIQLKLADADYIAFIIHICLSMQRTEREFHLSEQTIEKNQMKNWDEYSILIHIRDELHRIYSIKLNDVEITYLATILRGSKLVEPENTYYDRVLISRSVRKMIQDVSKQLNVDLSGDFSLFQGLMAHMEPTIYRMNLGTPSFNPLKEEIHDKYPILFMAVRTSVAQVFQNLVFSDDEIAYIVLHFGSALELKKEEVQIRALIVCPTGIGTSKMLASRIKNEIPEITSTDVVSIKEIYHKNWKDYQIILSTVLLPLQEKFEYVYVNPLLHEKDIQSIRDYLGTHIKEITKQTTYQSEFNLLSNNQKKNQNLSLQRFMEEIDICQNAIRTLLRNFSVNRVKNEPTYEEFLWKIVKAEEDKGTVKTADPVFQQLKQRETKGGLGIPGTNMALFHCRHGNVKELTFRLAHLESPYRLLGMNGEEMDVHNILLLLAPELLNELQLEIISMVSTIIVESKENIMIFSAANEKMIRTKLEEAFLSFLQNKFEKE